MTIAHDYLDAIVGRMREPMEPVGFEPDWADKPWRHKPYPNEPRFPLPARDVRRRAPLADGLTGAGNAAGGRFALGSLADLLRVSYGLSGRRLAVHANEDAPGLPRYHRSVLSRGTASGGGLYPAEIYWVSGPAGPFTAGVYYYATPHHAMQRLLAGDVTDQVRAALPDGAGADTTDQFLLVSLKFWKNAFKYNSFCYHAVTMDVGTLLGTWATWSAAHGLALRPALSFDEEAANRLLGLATRDESVFAIVPLPWHTAGVAREPSAGPVVEPRVTAEAAERSRRVVRFAWVTDLHAATVTDDRRPTSTALTAAAPRTPEHPAADVIPLPDPSGPAMDVTDALAARRSSFGRFSSHRPLTLPALSTLLAGATAGGRLVSDQKDADGAPALTRLVVFVNHVQDVPPGIYDYDAEGNTLGAVSRGDEGQFLQRNYFLSNYNLEQPAAVLVVVARPGAVLDLVGARGYRVVNAEVGAVAQATYTTCAALGIGCGAALGFDNVSYLERLGLEETDERPMLILLVGNERAGSPDVDSTIR